MDVVLRLDTQANVVEVFVCLRDIFTLLADQDACQLSSKDHINERHEFLVFWDRDGFFRGRSIVVAL
jgi:hypothetical protein